MRGCRSTFWHYRALLLVIMLAGCKGQSERPELVWGKRGVRGGELVKPRSIAIAPDDRVYLVDMTARIQGFDRDGKYLDIIWKPPDYSNGRPSGLSIHHFGPGIHDYHVIVSDSHYQAVRVYSPGGNLLQTVGGVAGTEPGKLGYVSGAVCDAAGNFFVSEFGENQRISKFAPDGTFLTAWGSPGVAPGQFQRIRALTIGADGHLYVADTGNHRIQVFTTDGKFVRTFGSAGKEPGELSYPFDVACSTGPTPFLYVVEKGNARVQKFTLAGESVACWGGFGRAPGQLNNPWALAVDRHGRVHVVDSENDRVQRISF